MGGYTYRHRVMRGIYEVASDMGSGAMIYIPGLIKIGIGNQKLRQQCDIIGLLLFFQNKESRLKLCISTLS
jgi:hypothetical protein